MDNKTAAAAALAVDAIASATAQIVLQQQGGDVKEQPQAQAHQQDEEDGGDGSKRQQPISTAAVPQPQQQPQGLEVVETDPTKRYLRYNVLLGRGAFKRVYKAFDSREGIEVAWNQVELSGGRLDDGHRERLFAEIRVLRSLSHRNILALRDWWYDAPAGVLSFVTELCTSGTLRQYRKKHRAIGGSAVKRWAYQILEGLVYLHAHDPPIIHRDLKCDNILVNGASGAVKIGDLGLASCRRGLSVVGTPEFMAPEVYDEVYDEKVDIYSFGMCVLELATCEYPYSECRSVPAIWRRVSQKVPPAALARVACPELRAFILECIAFDPQQRPGALALLKHGFFDSLRADAAAAGSPAGVWSIRVRSFAPVASSDGSGGDDRALSGSSGSPVQAAGRASSGVQQHVVAATSRPHPLRIPCASAGSDCSDTDGASDEDGDDDDDDDDDEEIVCPLADLLQGRYGSGSSSGGTSGDDDDGSTGGSGSGSGSSDGVRAHKVLAGAPGSGGDGAECDASRGGNIDGPRGGADAEDGPPVTRVGSARSVLQLPSGRVIASCAVLDKIVRHRRAASDLQRALSGQDLAADALLARALSRDGISVSAGGGGGGSSDSSGATKTAELAAPPSDASDAAAAAVLNTHALAAPELVVAAPLDLGRIVVRRRFAREIGGGGGGGSGGSSRLRRGKTAA